MDFKEFVNKLEQDLKDFLSDTSPGAQVRQTPVEKLQAGSYTGISITPADTNVGMNINADQLYAQMQDGRSYEGVLAMALSQVEHLTFCTLILSCGERVIGCKSETKL